jgi:DNA-binding GntR family transcriptional regulator
MTLRDLPATPPLLSDVVADALRQEILAGKLRPGTRLDIDELAVRFGVSRTPLDDGLRHLEDEGLVVIARRRGTFVAAIDARELAEVFDIRASLEALAARRAAERNAPQAMAPINQILAELAEAIAARDVDAHSRCNAAFHEQLVRMSDNRRLLSLYTSLHAQITIARVHAQSTSWTTRADLELREHQAIVEAIARGDGEAAARSVTQHIERAARSLTADLLQTAETDAAR